MKLLSHLRSVCLVLVAVSQGYAIAQTPLGVRRPSDNRPSTWASDDEAFEQETRTIIDADGQKVTQKKRRVRVPTRFDARGLPVDGYWKIVWEVVRVEPAGESIQRRVAPKTAFQAPAWVERGSLPGFSVTTDPEPQPKFLSRVADFITATEPGQYELIHVHHVGRQVLGPGLTPPWQAVVQLYDKNTDSASFWDVTLEPRARRSWVLTKADRLPQVSLDPPSVEDPEASITLADIRVAMAFVNGTDRELTIDWIDFEGNPITYATLDAGRTFDIETGAGHLWRFRHGDEQVDRYRATVDAQQRHVVRRSGHSPGPPIAFAKPEWVTLAESGVGVNARTVFDRDVFPFPPIALEIVGQMSNELGRECVLRRIPYYKTQRTAPNEYRPVPSPVFLVLEVTGAANDRPTVWDAKVTFTPEAKSWAAVRLADGQAYDGPAFVSGEIRGGGGGGTAPPRDFRLPNWVLTKQPPGGVLKLNENSAEMRSKANRAMGIIGRRTHSGPPLAPLRRLMHVGVQSTDPPKTYFVVELEDGQVLEVVMTERPGGSTSVRYTPLNN